MKFDPDSVAVITKRHVKRLARFNVVWGLIVLMAGCTSMPSVAPDPNPKGTETIPIISEPSGAVVESSTGDRCTTPCELEVGKNEKVSLSFEKEGFRTKYIKVRPVREEFPSRSVITYASIGAASGALAASMADIMGEVLSTVLVSALFGIKDPDEFEYKTDKSLIARGVLAGALVGLSIGYGVHRIVQEQRHRVREQVSVELKPVSN